MVLKILATTLLAVAEFLKTSLTCDCFSSKAFVSSKTMQEIARWYNVAINSVCGRVNELVERGYLIEIGSKKDVISGCSTAVLKPTERIA